MQRTPVITVILSTQQADAYAQFLKRVSVSDYARLARNVDEAYEMLDAGEAIREELRQAGYEPR
jgi:hypothetical protein